MVAHIDEVNIPISMTFPFSIAITSLPSGA
jgi:hypothetical protein